MGKLAVLSDEGMDDDVEFDRWIVGCGNLHDFLYCLYAPAVLAVAVSQRSRLGASAIA